MSKPTFIHNRFVIDGLMRACGISNYTQLAKKADIPRRSLMRLLSGRHAASERNSLALMRALGKRRLEDIGARPRADVLGSRSDAAGPSIPEGIAYRDELLEALAYDADGWASNGVAIARAVLNKLDAGDMRSRLAATAKLVSFLCNCGRNKEALAECDAALERARTAGQEVATSDEAYWCEYHGAIARRRDGDLDGARRVFERLCRLSFHRLAAMHQLAVIDIVTVRDFRLDPKQAREILERAERLLTECLQAWRGDYHEGFSRRRLGEVWFLRAQVKALRPRDIDAHACHVKAAGHLAKALVVFTRCGLARYVAATESALLALVLVKGQVVEHLPTINPDPSIDSHAGHRGPAGRAGGEAERPDEDAGEAASAARA